MVTILFCSPAGQHKHYSESHSYDEYFSIILDLIRKLLFDSINNTPSVDK